MIKTFKLFELHNKAKEFAKEAHKGQYRKPRKNQPELEYFIHPKTVAEIVERVKKSHRIKELVAAAYLHDVVQDTNYTLEDIKNEFGELVASLVEELTSDKEKIKLIGKTEYLKNKLLSLSSWGLVIKLADRLHNVSDLKDLIENGSTQDKKWAKDYAKKTKILMDALESSRKLTETQKNIVKEIKEKIDF